MNSKSDQLIPNCPKSNVLSEELIRCCAYKNRIDDQNVEARSLDDAEFTSKCCWKCLLDSTDRTTF